jgi:ABC-type Co2+ transport system permease subunit
MAPEIMAPDDLPARRSFVIRLAANLGLAVLGLLITHETAYSFATWLRPLPAGDGGGLVDHGHQSLLMATAGPLALWAVSWFVLRQARHLDVTATWGAGRLTAAVTGLYLAQETIEILAAGSTGPGISGLVQNRAILMGLVLIPLVARALLRLLDRAEELIQTWLADSVSMSVGSTPPVPNPPSTAAPSGVAHQPGDPRGPPVRDVTTIQAHFS